MDGEDQRRRTLRALIDLANGFSPSACWDDERAMELLRTQSTEEELRELGASEPMIAQIFSGPHGG
jgi:hypothetical protein